MNVKDKGIDAEWDAEFPDDSGFSSPLLGPGRNVFQYKQRDVFAAGRQRAFQGLVAALSGAAYEISARKGRCPSRYVLFTNLDLSHEQKHTLRSAILEGYGEPKAIHVEIVGAGELAALLNSYPHLRSSFFCTNQFRIWEDAWAAHTSAKLFGVNVKLVGREKELEALRTLVDDSRVRAVLLTGPHNIGKTRLALEATSHRPLEVVEALDSRSLSVAELLALPSPNVETVVILGDPDPEKTQNLVDQALATTNLKLVVTIPTADGAAMPSFGRDNRVQSLAIGPLSDTESEKLLKVAKANFDYSVQSWVIEQAGGNPGVLLVAASLRSELRATAADFSESVGMAFAERVRRILGQDAVEALRAFSLLTHVGVQGTRFKEIETVCSALDIADGPNKLLNLLRQVTNAGLVRRTGNYVEVQPPILANYLALSAIRGRYAEIVGLLAVFDQAARIRLLRRLRMLRGEEVIRFWDELFAPTGLFKDLPSALANAYLLRLLAGTVSERVASLIEEGLRHLSVEQRKEIRDGARRELVWTLEELLFRRGTSECALRCLVLLAEAENETWGNNATGVLSECFAPLHPQFPLPLAERLGVLRDMVGADKSVAMRLVGIKAIHAGLLRHGSVMLHRSSGPEPLDAWPRMTWSDVWNYVDDLVRLLMKMVETNDPRIALEASAELPHALFERAVQVGRNPETVVAHFEKVVERALTGKPDISVSSLVESLGDVIDHFKEATLTAETGMADRLRQSVIHLEELKRKLDSGSFAIRAKRWLGDWTRDGHEKVKDASGHELYRFDLQTRLLAEEAASDPAAIDEQLLDWLCSEEAKRAYAFFWWLGKCDADRRWLTRIERLGVEEGGQGSFASYFGGLAQTDANLVMQRLDRLACEGRVRAEAIIRASASAGIDAAGAARIVTLLQQGRVDPIFVAHGIRAGAFRSSVANKEFLELARAIAGPELQNASTVIGIAHSWLLEKKTLEGDLGEFAWQCLEAAQPIGRTDAYECDELASKLAESNIERAFRLLETLLSQPWDRECWNPLDRFGRGKLWEILRSADAGRMLRLAFKVAQENKLRGIALRWDLRDAINPSLDGDTLVQIASENEDMAKLVCQCLGAENEGFWRVALRIIEMYPNNESIQGRLASAAEHMGTVITGSYALHLENCHRDVEKVLGELNAPTAARSWLEKLENYFRNRAEQELLSEAEDEVNELRSPSEVPDAPERLWAIEVLCRHDKLENLRKLLPKNELIELLPKLSLLPEEVERIRAAVERW